LDEIAAGAPNGHYVDESSRGRDSATAKIGRCRLHPECHDEKAEVCCCIVQTLAESVPVMNQNGENGIPTADCEIGGEYVEKQRLGDGE